VHVAAFDKFSPLIFNRFPPRKFKTALAKTDVGDGVTAYVV
jgi:hypothetical protein